MVKKYFHRIGNRQWIFSVLRQDKTMANGDPLYTKLLIAADTPIRRYRKIKSNANPFDSEWALYFD